MSATSNILIFFIFQFQSISVIYNTVNEYFIFRHVEVRKAGKDKNSGGGGWGFHESVVI